MSRRASVRSSRASKRDLRHRVAQHAGSDRVALGVIGIQQALRRCPLDHLGQLPSQIHRILHTGVEALPTHRRMHVRRVASQQHPSLAVGRRLPGHIGEPGNPGGTVHPVIGPVDGDERLAEITQGRLRWCARRAVLSPRPAPAPRPPACPGNGRPAASRWMPHSGSSAISASAIRELVVGSHPGNSMPAALRIRLRPPSHPTRYSARSDWPSDSSTSTPVSSCAKPVTSRPR